MIQKGLVSVTFRNLSPEKIVALAKQAGLSAIEWGGDVHVPAGHLETATSVRTLTEEAGIFVASYGSYYRAGDNENPETSFLPVLKTAVALGAPVIRIWAGTKWSWEADEAYVEKVVSDTKTVCDMAKEHSIDIAYEYHGWSLTDTCLSATEVLKMVNKDNMYLYWQPNYNLQEAENLHALQTVLPYLKHVHCFYRGPDEERFPLEEGREIWTGFAEMLHADEKDHVVMLEFVKDGKEAQYLEDAKVLHALF